MEFLYILLAIVAGSSAPAQAGINSRLSAAIGGSAQAALISFFVGTLTLAAYAALLRLPWSPTKAFASVPWWVWMGGCIGAFFVAVTIFLVPRLGAATLMAALIAGQMTASIVLDHYGVLGYPLHPASAGRLLGVALIVGGVLLIRGF